MESITVFGGTPLYGKVAISGAKNGALPLLFASVLTEGDCIFYNMPNIGDVRLAVLILTAMGANAEWQDAHTLRINTRHLDPDATPTELCAGMRASAYLLGACLGRFGTAPPVLPGGCDFGNRPLNCHYDAFRAFGAEAEKMNGCLSAENGMHPANHAFPQVSVGATVNALLVAAGTPGTSCLSGCATEAHVVDLERFLCCLGADITGIGTACLTVRGQSHLHGASYVVAPDDIEAGTYLCAAAATGGKITLTDVTPRVLAPILTALTRAGCEITQDSTTVTLRRENRLRGTEVVTAPAPGFPTDLHPPLAAALCFADSESRIREEVWAQRFRYTAELERMGARLQVTDAHTLWIQPVPLHPATVTATDLRGGAAMLVAALGIPGRSVVHRRDLLERGYENLSRKLRAIGAEIC